MDRTRPTGPFRLLTLLAAVWTALGVPAVAQESQDQGVAQGEVQVNCPWFGVGGVVRPGEWAGLRLTVKDSSDKPRDVLLRITMTDADGDHPLYESRITTNPGVALPLWHYLYLPAGFKQQDVLEVSAFAAVEDQSAGFVAGRLLGKSRIAPRIVVWQGGGLYAVAGSRQMGLSKYANAENRPDLATGHERTDLAGQLTPDTLPDRWYGLRQFDALIWNDPPPANLGTEKAQAIREWVQHGGHLIVVLPRVGQTWTDEANNPLFDITPRVSVKRHEGVDLEPYRMLISKSPAGTDGKPAALPMPTSEVLQSFRPLDSTPGSDAICVLAGVEREAGAGREWLVVRRLVGAGMVDLVGVDVASRWMDTHGLPDAEAFWHRILGRRGVLLTPGELSALKNNVAVFGRSETHTMDRDIGGLIAMGERAAAGVLMGLVVFVAYWLVAGPLGYALLRKAGQVRHAWVGFVVAAGLFTALAWGGATAIRPATLKAQHLSIIDHVYNSSFAGSVDRVRSWVSLLVPQYGDATVSVGDPALKSMATLRNTIAPWEPEAATGGAFPDARGYRVDSRAPDQFTFPTRSTVKQFVVDWAGGSKLGMIHPTPLSEGGVPEVRITKSESGDVLRGILTHELPGPLRDVEIIVVRRQLDIGRWWGSRVLPPVLTTQSIAYSLPGDWKPGDFVDLSLVDMRNTGGKGSLLNMLNALSGSALGRADQTGDFDVDRSHLWNRLRAMTFFAHLDPPPRLDENQTRNPPLFQRKFTHGLDLSAWFTQPCVIVIGRLDQGDGGVCPAPLFVSTGGSFREVKTDGLTMVRWIYPLPADPPDFSSPTAADPVEELAPSERPAAESERKTPPRAPTKSTKRPRGQ